jgi:Fe-S-cluster containining protein
MCPKPGEEIGALHFRPDVKCCSFHPTLPNYLVGGILSGTDSELEEGRNRIREKIKNRIGVEPAGIGPSRKWSLLYEMAHHKSFGKTQTLICPYFERKEGSCTIWPFREAVCSTFFCKYERGEDGKRFWKGVKLYLKESESALTWHALGKMNWKWGSPESVMTEMTRERRTQEDRSLSPQEMEDQPPDEDTYTDLWGEWKGREEEFFRGCYEAVSSLDDREFTSVVGVKGDVLIKEVLEKHLLEMTDPDKKIGREVVTLKNGKYTRKKHIDPASKYW